MEQHNLVERSISGLDHISKVVDEANEIIRKYKTGEMYAYETFSRKLNDKITGLYKADQVVIAARSGVGEKPLIQLKLPSLKRENCWKILTRIISSRVNWEQLKGSTTNVWSPERTVKQHEHPPTEMLKI